MKSGFKESRIEKLSGMKPDLSRASFMTDASLRLLSKKSINGTIAK